MLTSLTFFVRFIVWIFTLLSIHHIFFLKFIHLICMDIFNLILIFRYIYIIWNVILYDFFFFFFKLNTFLYLWCSIFAKSIILLYIWQINLVFWIICNYNASIQIHRTFWFLNRHLLISIYLILICYKLFFLNRKI